MNVPSSFGEVFDGRTSMGGSRTAMKALVAFFVEVIDATST